MTARALILAVTFATVLPAAAAAQAQEWPREAPPPPLKARQVDFPAYQLKTFTNGLQVLFVPQREQPSVSYRLLIRAGAMQEPSEKPGVARSFSTTRGTQLKSSSESASRREYWYWLFVERPPIRSAG